MLALVLLLLVQYRLLDGMPVTQFTTNPTSDACPQPGCFYESKCYANYEEINRGHDGSNWCFGLVCIDGSLAAWDDWNCGTTSPPSTFPPSTTPPSSTPPNVPESTTPIGCVSNGIWYQPGSEVSRGSDENGNEWGTFCDDNGQLVAWDGWNRKTSTTPSETSMPPSPSTTDQTTTTELPTTTTPRPITTAPISPTPEDGCFEDGKWYPPGSEMSKGSDGDGWCYGAFCTDDGEVVFWDDWNCGPSTTEPPSTTPAPSTVPSPTTVPI